MMKKEHRRNNLSLNLRTHSSSTSRYLSNQKLMKSTNINDAKQMLLIYLYLIEQ